MILNPIISYYDFTNGRRNGGRVFVCGDIHGRFTELEAALKEVNFNKEIDTLICTGDLVDRGDESHKALQYLEELWFITVLGNHCEHVIKHETHNKERWYERGGIWHSKLTEEEKIVWMERFMKIPLAIEVKTRLGRFGIAHADLPTTNWELLYDLLFGHDLASNKVVKNRINCMLYSRHRFEQSGKGLGGDDCNIQGIDKVFFGHCGVPEVTTRGNCSWIDTFETTGKFTLVQIS